MITESNREVLKEVLESSSPSLFLGAGFSIGAKSNNPIPDGKGLGVYILESLLKSKVTVDEYNEIKKYDLRKITEVVNDIYGGKKELTQLLTDLFFGVTPDMERPFHLKLCSYPWKNIFTVNIDDLVENIYEKCKKTLFVQNESKLKIEPADCSVLFKLHGCVRKSDEGYIFSDSEYTELISKQLDAKLNRFVQEIQNRNIIFVGASLDEPDIKHYLSIYENAGCKYRTNRLIFIDPKPSISLKVIVKRLRAELIEATTEEFLDFVEELKYRPNESQKNLINLNYNGVHRLADLSKTFVTPYESKIYFGNNCSWQDVSDRWVIEKDSFIDARRKLDSIIEEKHDICAFAIYGPMFSGKSCLLKALGIHLFLQHFDVLEYRGQFLNRRAIWNYIKSGSSKNVAILIDCAAFYYEQIEKMLKNPIDGKQIVIITATREYYHKKKKYYLDGNRYISLRVEDEFGKGDPERIVKKLDEKSFLSFLSSYTYPEQVNYVKNKQSLVNLIIDLTYGNVAPRIKSEYVHMLVNFSGPEQQLLLELAIFDLVDIEVYPRELLAERYGKNVNLEPEVNSGEFSISDFARMDEKGISLRNSLLNKLIIRNNKKDIVNVIEKLLHFVAKYVKEKNNDVWYSIFQCLLKEEVLEQRLNLKVKEIETIFLSVKEDYTAISYYWLQLGLLYQKKKDFSTAFTYLEKSSSIRPHSYKIQHALARNYLRDANETNDIAKAKVSFEAGEKMMKELIDSSDPFKAKAKPFSVTSYVAEKLRFMERFALTVSKADLKYLLKILDDIKDLKDERMEKVYASMYAYLVKHDLTEMVRMEIDSPYLKYVGQNQFINDAITDEDILIDAIN